MDVPESKNIKPFEGSIEVDSAIQNQNTQEQYNTLHTNLSESEEVYKEQLIVNAEVVNCGGSNSASIEQNLGETMVTDVQVNSTELEGISLHDESIEQVIVTTLSEVISSENESINTVCGMNSTSDDLLVESCTDVKVEGTNIGSSDSLLEESLPSFIGEIDESVSLPPTEPLILEQGNIGDNHHKEVDAVNTENEIVLATTEDIAENKIIAENPIEKEISTGHLVANEILDENLVENDLIDESNEVIENTIKKEILTGNQTTLQKVMMTSEKLQTSENEMVTKSRSPAVIVTSNVIVNEIELSEPAQTGIIPSSESNIQYTVLPPGENSVYQDDGTLVVEYPLETNAIEHSQTTDIGEFIETNEATESMVHREDQIVKVEEKLIEYDENVIEMVDTPSEYESIESNIQSSGSVESATMTDRDVDPKVPTPKRKGRKAIEGIPPHIIGHSLGNHSLDVVNGKGLKPRLGVKIPYRKLASQIVSHAELQNHIIERARMKEEARSEAEKTNLFTKKLTHRLAQKLLPKKDATPKSNEPEKSGDEEIQLIENILSIMPSSASDQPTNPIEIVEQIVSENTSEKVGQIETTCPSESLEQAEIILADNVQASTNIGSNSDLIAILEGDGDESSIMNMPNVVEIIDTSENTSDIKAIEKEISLTDTKSPQSSTLVKEKKFFKSRESRTSDLSRDKVKESTPKGKSHLISTATKSKDVQTKKEDSQKATMFDTENMSVAKIAAKSTEPRKVPVVDQENSSHKGKSAGTVVEVEPQLKPAMALKTYTRKRKSNDVPTPEPAKKALIIPTLTSQPDPKIDCVTPVPPNVYITKSSRVIKKKVIWDPDEAMPSVRSQSKILNKIETTAKATPSKLPVTPKTPSKITEKKVLEKEKQSDSSKVIKTDEKKLPKSIEKEKRSVTEKQAIKKPEKPEMVKKTVPKTPTLDKTTPQSKIVITSCMKISPASKSPKKSTKRLSEIDKLLMDEGAVNMLNEINNSDDQKRRVGGRTSSTPTDKAQNQKELLNKASEIKNELTQGLNIDSSTPKVLRKKDGSTLLRKEMQEPSAITRKMSKDSTKSSTHSPPPSPAAFTHAETSRIIRRHSSSSFSSNEGLVQEELLDTSEEKEGENQTKSKEPVEESQETANDTNNKEEQNKTKATKKRTSIPSEEVSKKKLKRNDPVLSNGQPPKPTEIVVKSEPGIITGALKTDPSKAFTVIKMNKHYMINLTYKGGESYLSPQLLKDLVVTLRELERTRNCSVVSINSQGSAFCLGVDYKELVHSDKEVRSRKILEMSNGIREFLKCLLNFSKVIVAGVKGDCVGLGVTMLPLFDMIVATDTANFCTPYGKLGCPPEAGFFLSIPYQSNHGLASELLYTAQRMNADEAQRRGLVTKLFWPEKFDSEFRALLSHISNLSKPALMVTKRQLRQLHQKEAELEVSNNCKLLTKYWEGEECQKEFESYNALTFDIDNQ